MKYAIFEVTPVRGNFKRVSEFYNSESEAVSIMNKFYPSRTKVMSISKGKRQLVAYHRNCYK